MYCSKCGKENNNSNNYCIQCGAELKTKVNQTESNTVNSNVKEDKLVIKPNNNGNNLYIIATGAFVLIGLWILFGGDEMFTSNLLNFIMKIIALVDIVFFGYTMLFLIKRSQQNIDLVIVDNNGITDNSTTVSVGLIPWGDINEIYINSILNNKYILVKVEDERKYLNKMPFWKQQFMLASKKMGYEIIAINLNSTGVQPEKFLQEILKYRENLTKK